MEKLLFIARNDILNSESSTGRKVYTEYRYFCKHFNTTLISQTERKIVVTKELESSIVEECKNREKVLRIINEYIINYVKNGDVKNIYIRYPKSNPVFLRTLRELRRNGCRIIIEFPTYPYDAEIKTYGKTIRDKTIFCVDRMFRKKLKQYVYAAATFSEYTRIFGIPAFQIYNGLFVDEIKERKPIESNDIHIIAVAQIQRSHGYDRFLSGLAKYYECNREKKIYLHLIGDGPEKKMLEKMTIDNQLTQYVLFHGYCTGANLDSLYDNCSLALETLGFHRVGIRISSSLKSREYLSKGLPIITSADIDVVSEDFPYALKLAADETPVDMNDILAFYERVYSDSQQTVISAIRKYAKTHCDMDYTLQKVKEKFYE